MTDYTRAPKNVPIEDLVTLYEKHGTYSDVASALDMDRTGIMRRLKRYYASEEAKVDADPAVLSAMAETGMRDVGALHSGWLKTEGASLYFKMPQANHDVDVAMQLVEALADVPMAPPVPAPPVSNSDLLTVYPIADAHIGMLAWGAETGEDYDSKIASKRICSWMREVVDASPPSNTAIILDVGDLMHADDQKNMTPGSGHILDVDTRYFRTVDTTIWTVVQAIMIALEKHEKVIVVILKGNHDPNAYVAIMMAVAAHFRNEPRVEVQKRPGDFFAMEWGRCLIAANHGDKASAEKLVMALAATQSKMWGRTDYRYLFTGHKHSHKAADIGGVMWEQLRAITAQDYYASSHAFISMAQLSGITYHKDKGVKFRTFVGT